MLLCAGRDPGEVVQQTKAETESQPFASTTPPGPWQGNTSCTSCRCHTDRDHCVRPSWITLGLGYDTNLQYTSRALAFGSGYGSGERRPRMPSTPGGRTFTLLTG